MTKIRLSAFSDEAGASLKSQIEALVRNNITLTELRSVEGKNVSDFLDGECKAYKEAFNANGIRVFSIGSPLGKTDISADFKAYTKKVERVCEIANLFECDKIRIFSFFKAYGERNKVIEHLSEMVEIAQKYGVFLYHENEKDIYGDTADRVLDVVDNVKGLRSVYDPANYLQVGESADDTLHKTFARADYFHIKDFLVKTGELVPAGHGDGKIAEMVERMTGEKVLTIEPHLAVFKGYESIDSTKMKNKFAFASNDEAFDCAVRSMKEILIKAGYRENGGVFEK